ncbi:Kelch-like protein 10 [Nymphon striatum]|nr:Kelch-like protein 10 [Nymphon striatum]
MDDGSASDETESDYFINEGNDDGVTRIEERELKNIIEFAYAQKVKINDDNVQDLTVAAAQFKVIKLLEECIAYLLKNMDHHNCIGLWKFSSLYSFIKLRNQDDRLNVQTDKIVWGAVLKWVEFEEERRIKHYGGLLRTVRIVEYAFRENSENPKVTTHTTDGDTNVNEVQVSSMATGNWAHSDPGSLFTDYVHDVICKHPYSKNNKECSEYLHECPALCAPRKPSHILYVIGGFDSIDPTHEIEAYDFMSNLWTQVSIKRTNNMCRSHHGCIAIGHSIYIIGGTYDGGSDGYFCSTDCFVFNTLNNSWSEIAPMHVKRCYVSVAVLGGFVYAVGGMECPNTLGTVEKYDPSSNQWNYVASMNFVKSSASVNVINGKLYVIGGIEVFEEDLCLNTVEMFDPVTNKWSNLPSMAVRRGHVASVSNQGYIYALGGFDGRVTLKSVERFSPSLGYWTPLQDMNEAREDFSADVINNFIYVAGGFNGHTVLRSVECYDICQNTWHSLSPMAIPRAGITVCFVENAYPTNEDRSSSTEDSN